MLNVIGQVYVLGIYGMEDELNKFGLQYFGFGLDLDVISLFVENFLNMEFRENVQVVLMGFDKDFYYNKIYKVVSYLMDFNCYFVVINDVEIVVKIVLNRMQLIIGSLIQLVVVVLKRKFIVVGKFYILMFDCIMEKFLKINFKRILFVGDSLKVDIRFANNVDIDFVFVLIGVNIMKDLKDYFDVILNFVMLSFVEFCILQL